jgi:hypothetical protein
MLGPLVLAPLLVKFLHSPIVAARLTVYYYHSYRVPASSRVTDSHLPCSARRPPENSTISYILGPSVFRYAQQRFSKKSAGHSQI